MIILITGASSGIGYALARRFAINKDNKVIAMARNKSLLDELAMHGSDGNIIPLKLDLATYNYHGLLETLKKLDISKIDVVIHNAGLLINKPFAELSGEEWETTYKVNVFGVAQLTRTLLPYLGGGQPSHIVNISSIGGVNGSVKYPGLSAYSSSKGAICTLTECLAEELKGTNIFINCLALGSVQTEMLTKAFPNYSTSMQPGQISDFIHDFSLNGWKYFNGKILPVSTTNP